MSYSDVRVLSSSGVILYARPHIHFPISVSLLVFRAVPGQLLRGVVSQVGQDHLGLLIHGLFSAVIAASDIPAHYRYHPDVEAEGGQREAMLLNSRTAQPAQLLEGAEATLSKKAVAKLKKAQEKEARRAAYTAAHGGAAAAEEGKEGEGEGAAAAESPERFHRHIRVGSVVVLSVQSVHAAEGFFSLQGSLTADGAHLQPGEPIRPRAWRERQAAEAMERQRKEEEEATSAERLFGAEEEAEATTATAASQLPLQPPTSSLQLGMSKREMKEKKRAEKAERKAAKAQRRLQRREERGEGHGGVVVHEAVGAVSSAVSAAAAPERAGDRAERAKEEVAAFRKAQGEGEEEDDSNVVLNDDFSHIEEHRVTEDEEEHPPPPPAAKRRRARSTQLENEAAPAADAQQPNKKKHKRQQNGLLPH